ncbi:hypothetical protein DBZ36_05935 [Alginatibacterium sediminis]|uniref:Uncharacterized protein n=1 Tax=Alginatibacterium sediminis TaxID=2164068 RepID=A0A420EH47_9ALTE|nr:hypothetical protein DBZ36_05935 [Alginatibacterium sediminis]
MNVVVFSNFMGAIVLQWSNFSLPVYIKMKIAIANESLAAMNMIDPCFYTTAYKQLCVIWHINTSKNAHVIKLITDYFFLIAACYKSFSDFGDYNRPMLN